MKPERALGIVFKETYMDHNTSEWRYNYSTEISYMCMVCCSCAVAIIIMRGYATPYFLNNKGRSLG